MANRKISDKLKEELQPFLNSYTEMLIDGLVESNIIRKIKNPENNGVKAYELIRDIKDKISLSELPKQDNKLVTDFLLFRETMFNVYFYLGYDNSTNARQLPLSKLIEKFKSEGVLSLSKLDDSRLIDIFDKGELLLDDQEIEKDAITIFKKHNINFNSYINGLLEFYTYKKASQFFVDFKFDKELSIGNMSSRRKVDLAGKSDNGMDLIFEIKYRKRTLSTLKEMLFQGYEYLTHYDNDTGKSNFLILVAFTDEDANTFDKVHYRFKQNLEELFPDYVKRIFFVPVSTKHLHLIEDGFKKLSIQVQGSKIDTLMFSDNPKTITANDETLVDANFLRSPQGSFATWVKLKPVQEYYNKLMNSEYIISHATDNYKHIKMRYQNVFAIALAPNQTNNTHKNPTQILWRTWITNADRESSFLSGPPLSNEKEQWYHLLVRWNHSLPRIEFLIDGKLVEGNSEYRKFWPERETILDKAFIGGWGGRQNIHYLNLPQYRLITSSKFLSNEWVKAELKNNPIK